MSVKTGQKKENKLQEIIQASAGKAHRFAALMLSDKDETEEILLSAFRDFGDRFRTMEKEDPEWNSSLEVPLFQMAWKKIQRAIRRESLGFGTGRDTRVFSLTETNFLEKSASFSLADQEALQFRLKAVDADFRAPLVLKDILKFEDEEIVQILGVRWGVYRHRLHRGRLDFKDLLKGSPMGNVSELKPGWAT